MTITSRGGWRQTAFVAVAALACAGCGSSTSALRDIDPQAQSILRDMGQTLAHARQFEFTVRAATDRRVETEQLAQFHRTSQIAVARPDRLRVNTVSDEGNWTAWYSGKKFVLLDRESGAYASEPVPGRIQAMLDYLADEHDLTIPTADLLVEKPYDSLIENVESGEYLGQATVGDTACHHLLFCQANVDWQIWIAAGPQRLPRRLVITFKQEAGQPQYSANLDDWNLSPTFASDTFVFAPPPGAQSVDLQELLERGQGDSR